MRVDGVEGLDGDIGAGRAGDEYEREPRLPPPPARAHASEICTESPAITTRAITTRIRRCIMGTTSTRDCSAELQARENYRCSIATNLHAYGPVGRVNVHPWVTHAGAVFEPARTAPPPSVV